MGVVCVLAFDGCMSIKIFSKEDCFLVLLSEMKHTMVPCQLQH
jgi:hypothetical protein